MIQTAGTTAHKLQSCCYVCKMFMQERAAATDCMGKYNIKHPMLDKVRECSAQPEEAASFFGGMLWPVLQQRFNACGLQSGYLEKVYLQMQTDQAHLQQATGKHLAAVLSCNTSL